MPVICAHLEFIRLYAEYYEAIEEPMDLSSVQEKFKGSKYPTLQALYDDLHLISSNCKAYNLEGSEIYEQAEQFQNFIDALFEVQCVLTECCRLRHPQLALTCAVGKVRPPPRRRRLLRGRRAGEAKARVV
jgi:hypothetical protein